MPFNSDSYRRNLYRRLALTSLAQAREIKFRAAIGKAYDWEIERIPRLVQLARIDWRLYLSQRRICEL